MSSCHGLGLQGVRENRAREAHRHQGTGRARRHRRGRAQRHALPAVRILSLLGGERRRSSCTCPWGRWWTHRRSARHTTYSSAPRRHGSRSPTTCLSSTSTRPEVRGLEDGYPASTLSGWRWRSPGSRRSHGGCGASCSIRSVELSVADVVGRLCGVQAQVASSAELAVRVRRETSRPGEVDRALRDGRLIKTWAMRGTLHLLTPEEAGALPLAHGLRPIVGAAELAALLRHDAEADGGASPGGPRGARGRTADPRRAGRRRSSRKRGLRHVGEGLRSGWGTLLKPLAWQGDLCFGPSQGSRVTFMRPEDASSRWARPSRSGGGGGRRDRRVLPRLRAGDDRRLRQLAGRRLVRQAAASNLVQRARRPARAEVDVDGEPAYVLAEDLDELASTTPTTAVRLLAGLRSVRARPRHRRRPRRADVAACRGQQAERLDLAGRRGRRRRPRHLGAGRRPSARGLVRGSRKPPRNALRAEVTRLSSILDRDLRHGDRHRLA